MNTVVYHRADFDGQFSAAVCAKFLPDGTAFIGWDYGDPLIDFPSGMVYVVDLSPDCFKGIPTDATSRLIWIDHHKSSISKWDDKLGNPFKGYRIDGVAACRLCWQWFTYDDQCGGLGWALPRLDDFKARRVAEPLALTLAGEYDIWELSDERSVPFQFGLTAAGYAWDDGLISMLDKPKDLTITGEWVFPGDVEVRQVVNDGRAAMNWQKAFASQVCAERSYVREWEGRTFCVLASCHARNSMWFPPDAIPSECNALMCWRYAGEQVAFSLYHAPGHEEHDLSVIASKYGGGGHRGACGFSMSLTDALHVIQ